MQRTDWNALHTEGLAQRFREMRGKLGFERQEDFAKSLGRSRNSISAYERGQAAPDGETLMRLAQLGVNIQWLLTGQGAMRAGDDSLPAIAVAAGAAPLDEDLMAAIADGVAQTYKQEGARLSEGDKGRLIARIHNDLVAAYDDPDERKIGLKVALQQLRRDLQAAPTADQSKRLA